MLGKVIKYDLKATARYFIPLYLALGGITLLNKLSLELFANTSSTRFSRTIMVALMVFYIIFLVGGIFLNYVILTVYFYKNLTGDEGYLTFTLPVKTSTIINGKFITGLIWSFLSNIIVLLSVMFLISGHGVLKELFVHLPRYMDRYYDISMRRVITFSFLLTVSYIASLLRTIFMLYASISLGQFFGKYKILGAIASYIGLSFLSQIIGLITAVFTGVISNIDFNGFKTLSLSLIVSLMITILACAVYYILTVYIFDKKLNLE